MADSDTLHKAYIDFQNDDLRALYRFLYRDLLLYASSLLPGSLSLLAEDCVQNSIEKAYYERHKFSSGSHLKAFIYRCIYNEAVSMLRSRNARDHYQLSLASGDWNIEEDFLTGYIRSETLARLYNAIDSLPEDMRQLLSMSFEQGMKNREIAEALGVAEITVKKRKALLLRLLRDRFILIFIYFPEVLTALES